MRLVIALYLIFCLASAEPGPAQVLEPGQTDRELDALILSRVPGLVVPLSGEEWQTQAGELRRRVLENVVFRGWPREIVERRASLRILGDSTIETGKGYRIQKLLYEPFPGLSIPALLYEPDVRADPLDAKAPVVLVVNGHVGPPGKSVEDKQILCANLAKRGMLALNPEWFDYGELGLPGNGHEHMGWIDLCGRSGVALFYLALRGGIDVLLEHPAADPTRVAVTGLSGGGWQSIFLAALDERVKVCAPNAGYIGQATRLHYNGDVGDIEQDPVDLLLEADYTHLTAMLWPRPALLIYNARDECCFPAARARSSVYDPVLPFYQRFAIRSEFSFHENEWPGNHNYGLDNRQAFYRFLNRQFIPASRRIDDEIPCDGEVFSFDALKVGVPQGNASLRSIAEEIAGELPAIRADRLCADRRLASERRSCLRDVLRLPRVQVDITKALQSPGGREVLLRLESGISFPVSVSGDVGRPITILLADQGRASVRDRSADLLKSGRRVIAADLLLTGECRPKRLGAWPYAILLSDAGVRPLGQMVAQVLTLLKAFADDLLGIDVEIEAYGATTSVVALVAAAVDSGAVHGDVITKVTLHGLPRSLKDLIRSGQTLGRWPAIHTFGLLEAVDIEELKALARPGSIDVKE